MPIPNCNLKTFDTTLIVHYNKKPFQYPEIDLWGLEVMMVEGEEVFTVELVFDKEDEAWEIVKHFNSSITPIIWEPPDEEN